MIFGNASVGSSAPNVKYYGHGWGLDFYFCNVNDVLASIFLNLELRASVPDKNRPNLLWVWVYMKSPRHDGLSSQSEFDVLCAIDETLSETLREKFDAVFCG